MIKTKFLEVTRPQGFVEKVPVKSLLVYLPSIHSSENNSLDKFSITDNSDIQYSYKDFKVDLSSALVVDTPTEVYLNQVNVTGSRSNSSSFKINGDHEDRLIAESYDVSEFSGALTAGVNIEDLGISNFSVGTDDKDDGSQTDIATTGGSGTGLTVSYDVGGGEILVESLVVFFGGNGGYLFGETISIQSTGTKDTTFDIGHFVLVNNLEKTITFDGSDAVYVSIGNNSISLLNNGSRPCNSHFIEHGQPLKYSNGGGSDITGLTDTVTYYALNELSRIAFNQNSDSLDSDIITTLHNKPHGLKVGDLIQYYINGSSDVDLINYKSYYVRTVLSTDTFQLDTASSNNSYSATGAKSLKSDSSSNVQYFYPTIKLGANEESVLTYGISPVVKVITGVGSGTSHTLKLVLADYNVETDFNIAFSGISCGHDLSSTNIYRSITNRVETLLRSNGLYKIEFEEPTTNKPTSVFLAMMTGSYPNIKSNRKNFFINSTLFNSVDSGSVGFVAFNNDKITLNGEISITGKNGTTLTITNNFSLKNMPSLESLTFMYINNSGASDIQNLTNGKIYNFVYDGVSGTIYNFYGTNIYDRTKSDYPSTTASPAINMGSNQTGMSNHKLVACIPFIEGDRITLYSLSYTSEGMPSISPGVYDLENYYIQNIGTKTELTTESTAPLVGIFNFATGSSDKTNTTRTNIATTGGSGSGLTVSYEVTGNNILESSLVIHTIGSGYTRLDTITITDPTTGPAPAIQATFQLVRILAVPNSFNIARCILYDKNNNYNNYILGKDNLGRRIRFRTLGITTTDTELAGYLGLRPSASDVSDIFTAEASAPGIDFFSSLNFSSISFSSGDTTVTVGGGGHADMGSAIQIVSGIGIPSGTLMNGATVDPGTNRITSFTMKNLNGTTGIQTTAASSGEYTFIERGTAYQSDGFVIYTMPDPDEQYFILGIDEFDIKNTTNNLKIKDKLILPNHKNGGINESPDDFGFVNLSGKKYNYVSTLQPKAIRELNCTFTTADGSSSIFPSPYGNVEADGTLGYMNSKDFYNNDISMEFIFIPETIANDVVFD